MVEKKSNGIVDGFIMDNDEIMRKYIILSLNNLDVTEFKKKFEVSPYELFQKNLTFFLRTT